MSGCSQQRSWLDLTPAQQKRELRRCADGAASIGVDLNAVVAVVRVEEGEPGGPLRGLPYAAKDMFDRVERRGEWGGCRAPGSAPADAEILSRLDGAGARQVAFTSMSALAYEPSGYNAALGRTLNPWHPEIVAGGSSSGSAALVAAGAASVAVGSDTGGSVRVPAACCGILGLKPGWGRLPTAGAMELSPSLDVVGLLARHAADLAAAWAAVSGDDGQAGEGQAGEGTGAAIGSLAVMADSVQLAEPLVRGRLADAFKVLASLGIRMQEVGNRDIVAEADAAALTIMQAEAALIHGGEGSAAASDPKLMRRLAKGASISGGELAEARKARSGLAARFLESLAGCDAAILPVMPMVTPLARETDPQSAEFNPRTLYAMTSLTRFVNALGLPAIAIPIGFDDRGAPVGMQVVGRPGAERSLVELAARLERALPELDRMPPIHVGPAAQDPSS